MQDKKIYLNIVLTVVVSYILIKVIDNYKYFFGVISLLMSLLTPFIIAFVLAYIFNPLVKFLESKLNFKRIYSLLLTYGVLIVILISFILFTVPSIVNSLADLVAQIPTYIDKTEQFLFDLGKSLQSVDPNTLKEYGDKIMSVMPKFSNLLIGSLGGIFSTTFSVGKFIVQFLLGFIICFYILLEKEKFLLFTKKVVYISLGKKYGDFIIELCQSLNLNIGKYFTALLFGTLMGVMNMVPYFGPVIGMAQVVIINLFSNPTIALTSLIYLIIIQQVEVTFIEPKIVGGQLGLSPFFTILAVTVGGGFFGIPGMILSAPVMGVIKIYFCEFVNRRHDKIQME